MEIIWLAYCLLSMKVHVWIAKYPSNHAVDDTLELLLNKLSVLADTIMQYAHVGWSQVYYVSGSILFIKIPPF